MAKPPNEEETCFESINTSSLTTTMSNSFGSTKQPVEPSRSLRFTLFPKLPVELRLKVELSYHTIKVRLIYLDKIGLYSIRCKLWGASLMYPKPHSVLSDHGSRLVEQIR